MVFSGAMKFSTRPRCACRVLAPAVAPGRHSAKRQPFVKRLAPPAAQDDAQNKPVKVNKLNIPADALAALAGVDGTSSKLDIDILESVADLPMTDGIIEYRVRAAALEQWRLSLSKGVLPDLRTMPFPVEPFKSKFAEALSSLEMPRFMRRYPKLADAMVREMLLLTKDFETKLLEMQAEEQQQQSNPPPAQSQSAGAGGEQSEPQEGEEGEGSGDSGAAPDDEEANDGEEGDQQSGTGGEGSQELQVSLEMSEGDGGNEGASTQGPDDGEMSDAMAELAEKLADDLVNAFEEKMSPIVDSLEAAAGHLGDLDELLDGQKGWDLSASVWQKSGWKEFKDLRKKLENLRELRDLVRSLGRGGGKGPVRMAAEEVYAPGKPPGVIRSPRVPEEVRALHRSDNFSQMLPSEVALLALGWPRGEDTHSDISDLSDVESDSNWNDVEGGSDEDGGRGRSEERGSHPARLLFMARMAEKSLMCYERSGWLEDEPTRVTGRREMRPAAELGPIIVCLDTSGSMRGPRELVAKALVLECMRGAHTQNRRCFVYAFSGPRQVETLELGMNVNALEQLLDFLQFSFSGGTDVDAPFELALQRLESEEWQAADILLVTDGEIPPPNTYLLEKINGFTKTLGLEVHGLLVGSDVTLPMKDLCTHVHVFKSWSSVGGQAMY